jgi:ubiquinone/menaquinone biosynthesis C-methylase UbiE
MSVYDSMAADFDRRRALPDGMVETIRQTVLQAGLPARPRVLDLGAGSGRIGWPFVGAGDDYVGVDLSGGMIRAFAARHPGARLVQADGAVLPFRDESFDAVLLIQVLSGVPGWRALLADARRVLRRSGALFIGRVVAPDTGVDAAMKAQAAAILDEMGVHPYRDKPRDQALGWLLAAMPDPTAVTVASWIAERTPRGFLERHGEGARLARLEQPVRDVALRRLSAWAAETFGSIDRACAEDFRFELTIHRFQQGTVPACQMP